MVNLNLIKLAANVLAIVNYWERWDGHDRTYNITNDRRQHSLVISRTSQSSPSPIWHLRGYRPSLWLIKTVDRLGAWGWIISFVLKCENRCWNILLFYSIKACIVSNLLCFTTEDRETRWTHNLIKVSCITIRAKARGKLRLHQITGSLYTYSRVSGNKGWFHM